MIVAVPADTPVTIPDIPIPIGTAVATPVAEELQLPPATESLNAVVAPSHTTAVPFIIGGRAFTIIIFVAPQPSLSI